MDRNTPVYIKDDTKYDKSHFVLPKHYTSSLKYVLIPRGVMNDRIEKLALDIRRAFGNDELHLLCILKGSRGFFSELITLLNKIHRYSSNGMYDRPPFFEHYVRLKSYQNMESGGELQVMCDDLSVLKGKNVVIVEDIIDTGNTLIKFMKYLMQFGPKVVKVTSLLEKRTPLATFKGDFIGFSVPDVFIVGYCLDYNENFRDLDHLCVMNDEGIAKYRE